MEAENEGKNEEEDGRSDSQVKSTKGNWRESKAKIPRGRWGNLTKNSHLA